MNNIKLNFLVCPRDLHPLHLLHVSYCGRQPQRTKRRVEMERIIPCTKELSENAITFNVSSTEKVSDISFESRALKGVMHLPQINIHWDFETHMLNLVAFDPLVTPSEASCTFATIS